MSVRDESVADGRRRGLNLDVVGAFGSIFAALCCVGVPALVAIVSAAGLGFLIHDSILVPMLFISLVVSLSGLYLGVRQHGRREALLLGGLSAGVLVVGMVFLKNHLLVGLGIAGLLAATFWNVALRTQQLRVRT